MAGTDSGAQHTHLSSVTNTHTLTYKPTNTGTCRHKGKHAHIYRAPICVNACSNSTQNQGDLIFQLSSSGVFVLLRITPYRAFGQEGQIKKKNSIFDPCNPVRQELYERRLFWTEVKHEKTSDSSSIKIILTF